MFFHDLTKSFNFYQLTILDFKQEFITRLP